MNASDLIGSLLQGGMSGSTNNRVMSAFGQGGQAAQGGLGPIGDALGGLLGGAQGGGGSAGLAGLLGSMGGQQAPGGAGGLGSMLQGLMGQASGAVGGNQNLALGGMGALVGSLMGGGGGAMKGALGGGAMAVLGALAYNAYMKRSDGTVAPPAAPQDVPLSLRQPQNAQEEAELESEANLVLEAMLNAAKADGQIDDQELEKIGGKLQEAGADPEARQWVLREMRAPLDLDGLAAKVKSPQMAAQLYAASLLAIEVDTQAERDYLDALAARTGLEPHVARNLEQSLGVAR